ncbi:hypothetical protein RDI58_004244 [Solanum bulbocastanum]|uniref:RING-type E3 ubiquitin transferase n=1 Tax=Solanum bulbocastanum TaxID=147425 RepID=A0AAN8YPS5_SOLBU
MSQVRNIVESNKGYCGVLELSVDVKLISRDDIEERISFPGEDLSSHYGMVPASESSIQSLFKKIVIDEEITEGEECVACLEELVKKESDHHEIVSMPCSHMFHGERITKCLGSSSSSSATQK